MSGNEFKEIIIVMCARRTVVTPAVAAGVVAEVPCLLTHIPCEVKIAFFIAQKEIM